MRNQEGFIEVPGGKVWYSKMGEGDRTPLLVLHGGPGNTHDPLKAALGVLASDRPVIFYDQLGSGNSNRPHDRSLWKLERFVEELACVREALNLNPVHILGHSWGTMLAASYLVDRKPAGVNSIIFSSPCLDAERWKQDADRLLAQLPADVQQTIQKHQENGTTSSEKYREAMQVFERQHVCRLDPRPSVLSVSRQKANHSVYLTMWGPSEFYPTGNLKTYNVTPDLSAIALPALFLCGRYDEATPESTQYYQSLVPGAEMCVFENSSHLSYLEETDAYISVVRSFLGQVEGR
ncbi:alpha/beta fold hydrolase [Cohnella pontilimi]|uniref:Proline iminopeptidase n=1 Tax=Cohnella pontilimi TaxID=2564100 RepID=A0A4U0F9E3_9BACL|nr:proline iminopeptidase-family hydrolase [Cohnella pontilimi]TJY41307.1 alpha/beta fold hydrolase [Cohnella pontilimi]